MVLQIEATYCVVIAQLTYMHETLVIPYKEISHITKLSQFDTQIMGLKPNPSYGKSHAPNADKFLPQTVNEKFEVNHFKIYMKSGAAYFVQLNNFNGMYVKVEMQKEDAEIEVKKRSGEVKKLYLRILKYITK